MNGLQPEGMMVSEREHARQNCEIIGHRWIEEYYGYTCENCGEFIPYGCEPDTDPDIDHVCECGRAATEACTLCGLPMCSMCFECGCGVCDYHRG